jgi:hypothetical protein
MYVAYLIVITRGPYSISQSEEETGGFVDVPCHHLNEEAGIPAWVKIRTRTLTKATDKEADGLPTITMCLSIKLHIRHLYADHYRYQMLTYAVS